MSFFSPKESNGPSRFSLKCAWLFALAIAALPACRKHEPLPQPPAPANYTGPLERGLPESLDSLNGFLCAENGRTDWNNFPYSATRIASFAEPGAPLMDEFSRMQAYLAGNGHGNISVGDVRFGGNKLPEGRTDERVIYEYYTTAAHINTPTPVWEIEGYKSIAGFEVNLGTWPAIFDTAVTPTITISAGWTMDVDEYCAGYDSVIVVLNHQYNSGSIVKRSTSAFPAITFSKDELKAIASQYPRLTIRACRYSHMFIDGRLYVFELIRRFEKTINSKG